MAVAIIPRLTKAQITEMMNKKRAAIERAIISRLQFAGENFVSLARQNGTYNDITGNLRSSIGYVILKDGAQIRQSFPGATKEGKKNARKVMDDAVSQFASGYVLIVVAGMEYAAAVESKGKDVLTASSKIIEVDLKKALSELSKKIAA